MKRDLTPADWSLGTARDGALMLHGLKLTELATAYGTPLHVIDEERLGRTARGVARDLTTTYPGKSSVHYAFKCNGVPEVIRVIRAAGLKAEIATEQELWLALTSGFRGDEIIVNGPCKSTSFLEASIGAGVRLIIVDAVEELGALARVCARAGRVADILLRLNPDVTPRKSNNGSATGSRKGCAFGLDLAGGEAHYALHRLEELEWLRFRGFHFHIGTGIIDPSDYVKAVGRVAPIAAYARSLGRAVDILDIGGGIASPTARELTSMEMLIYQGLNRFPSRIGRARPASIREFGGQIAGAVQKYFQGNPLPELLFEPGRCIASGSQFLLLRIHHVKKRHGVVPWIITDGGLGTVTLPSYYEYHELFLCDDARRPRSRRATILGPCCFAGDIVYRNRRLPVVSPGEVLALMDSGAYFTALESSFGIPRPAIIAVGATGARITRRRETVEEMVERDSTCESATKGV